MFRLRFEPTTPVFEQAQIFRFLSARPL
jgi:hypothetical protein